MAGLSQGASTLPAKPLPAAGLMGMFWIARSQVGIVCTAAAATLPTGGGPAGSASCCCPALFAGPLGCMLAAGVARLMPFHTAELFRPAWHAAAAGRCAYHVPDGAAGICGNAGVCTMGRYENGVYPPALTSLPCFAVLSALFLRFSRFPDFELDPA